MLHYRLILWYIKILRQTVEKSPALLKVSGYLSYNQTFSGQSCQCVQDKSAFVKKYVTVT